LPAGAKNRIAISGLGELEIDKTVEDRLAFVCARGMAITARELGENKDQKDQAEQMHGTHL